ncbi:MAG: hypothetical protein AB7O88_21050 [Reyranellaceae bacterium]
MRNRLAVLASIVLAFGLAAAGPAVAEQKKPGGKPTAVNRKGAGEPTCFNRSLCNNENVESIRSNNKGDGKGKGGTPK